MAIQITDNLAIWRPGDQNYKITVNDIDEYLMPTFVERAGDSMIGPLELLAPTKDEHLVTKKYVDDRYQEVLDTIGIDLSDLSRGNYILSGRPGMPGEVAWGAAGGKPYVDKWSEVGDIWISHTNQAGEFNNFSDVKVGEYIYLYKNDQDWGLYEITSIDPTGDGFVSDYMLFYVDYVESADEYVPYFGDTLTIYTIAYDGSNGIDLPVLENHLDGLYFPLKGGTINGVLNVDNIDASDIVPRDLTRLPVL